MGATKDFSLAAVSGIYVGRFETGSYARKRTRARVVASLWIFFFFFSFLRGAMSKFLDSFMRLAEPSEMPEHCGVVAFV